MKAQVVIIILSVLSLTSLSFADDRAMAPQSIAAPAVATPDLLATTPATDLSNLYNFIPSRAPNFGRAYQAAQQKAGSRDETAIDCRNDMRGTVRQAKPRPIVVQPLPTILRAAARAGISEQQVRYSLAAYQSQRSVLRNNRYVTIVNYGKNSNVPRMYVIDLVTAQISSYKVTHGERSGGHGAPATGFSNENGTHMSSVGCAMTGGFYGGSNGKSMRLHGLEVGRNDNMCVRTIVMHGGWYASVGGRSHGCPAVEEGKRDEIFAKIGHGSMYCAFPR